MTTAVVDSPKNEQALASRFVDTLVLEHPCAPEVDPVVFETTVPVRSAPRLYEHARRTRRPGRLVARWIPDPRGEQSAICIWVPQNGAEA